MNPDGQVYAGFADRPLPEEDKERYLKAAREEAETTIEELKRQMSEAADVEED